MMNVTYKVLKHKKVVFYEENGYCFNKLYFMKEKKYDLLVKIKVSAKNKKLEGFWLDLMKQIEPSFKIVNINKEKWCNFRVNGHGKMRIITTILRYLWEDINRYDDVVIMTKYVFNNYPKIDPLSAIYIAASCLEKSGGWGHSLVPGIADWIPKTWHYRRYNGREAQEFSSKSTSDYIIKAKILERFRDEKNSRYDVLPSIKHYEIDKKYNKFKYSYGSINISRGRSWDGKE